MFQLLLHHFSLYPYRCSLFLSFMLMLGLVKGNAQATGNNLFKKPTVKELQQQSFAPPSSTFQPITLTPIHCNPLAGDNATEQQNNRILAQHGMLPGQSTKQREYEELKQELREEAIKEQLAQRLAWQQPFQNNLQAFLSFNPDSFSITKAIYLCESAWYSNPPSWPEFKTVIQERTQLVRQILKREGLRSKNPIAVHYAIQQLYQQDHPFIEPATHKSVTVPALRYDFDDFRGEKNWSNLFVTKLLTTGTGQCHSLPLLYLAIAEQLGVKAYLSLSPEHSFIQFFDGGGQRYNFETTNGHLVSTAWLMQSSFVNATALKNRTYLDTLSSRELYAQLLSDLLQTYTNKLGYDEWAWQLTSKILSIHPTNLNALMTQANFYTFIARQKISEAGNPPLAQLVNYPAAYQAYQQMQQAYERVEQTGFQEMPKEDYQQWLKTMEEEKRKQESRGQQQQLKTAAGKVKKTGATKSKK